MNEGITPYSIDLMGVIQGSFDITKQTRCFSTCINGNAKYDALIIIIILTMLHVYLGRKQHGWDVADHRRAKCKYSTEETHDEGSDGNSERAPSLLVNCSLQDENTSNTVSDCGFDQGINGRTAAD